MYELFILSKLLHRPMHGYLLQTILNYAIGPTRRVSWGTLYPLIRRLEEHGYIAATETDGDDPRGKKLYRTTKAGRARFLKLMSDPGEHNAATADLFRVKIGCFGHVDNDLRLRIMSDYRRQLTEILSHSALMKKSLKKEAGLQQTEKRFALLALDHQQAVAKLELRWVESALREWTGTRESTKAVTS